MPNDVEKIKELEKSHKKLEEEQKDLKHEQDHLKDELHKKGDEIRKEIGVIKDIALSNSGKLDGIQSIIDQTKGGLKVVGKIIDASIIISFIVTTYLAMAHGIK